MTKIVVFSGGRGTRYMQEALSGVDCEVTFLVNGYDSGLSTGRIRWAFDGMLGPSDFRKCITTALAQGSLWSPATGRLLEDREVTAELAAAYAARGSGAIVETLAKTQPGLDIGTFVPMLSWLTAFLDSAPVAGGLLDLQDMPLGNALFAGAFVEQSSDFNAALVGMRGAFLAASSVAVCDVTKGEDLWLAARTSTHLCVDEGAIVSGRPPGRITELMLLPRGVTRQLWESHGMWAPLDPETERLLDASKTRPELSPEARRAMSEADLIVYGSGTQHSSILPSFLTRGLSSAIAANRKARKLLFVNGTRDLDFHTSEGPQDLLDKSRALLVGDEDLPFASLVTGIYAATLDWDGADGSSSRAVLEAEGIPVTNAARPVLNATDAYSGFAAALAQEMGHVIAPSSTVVSVVVPVLNEIDTLPELLDQLETLTHMQGLSVERVLVDGGSTDGSWELIQACPWVAGYRADGRAGRAACILEGVRRSRGERVCVYHADLEYQPSDIAHLVGVGLAYPEGMILGSRNHGAGSERNLRRMYGDRRFLFWTARLGGILVGALLSLRLGRILSDPLCGLFTACRDVLLRCLDGSGGIDANVRMLVRASHQELQIVEAGVSFSPRTREAGKKTSVRDGLRALVSAIMPVPPAPSAPAEAERPVPASADAETPSPDLRRAG